MGGFAEEYVALGHNLEQTGRFIPDAPFPFVFRPPGYPVFIASVFRAWRLLPNQEHLVRNPQAANERSHPPKHTIYLAQSILASLSAVFLFLWIARYTSPTNAIILALLFGCNPYVIILAGFLHYETLHLFFLIVAGYVLTLAFEKHSFHPAKTLAAGLLWGLCTLIRPMTLILPLFILPMARLNATSSFRAAFKPTIIFVIGMVLTIAPYSIRNYAISNRFIAVNAQTGIAMWVATTTQPKPSANHYNWWDLWYGAGERICQKVITNQECTPAQYVAHNIQLENEFKKQALENFSNSPGVFFKNFLQTFISFNLAINSVFIKIFQAIQIPDKEINIKKWLEPGNPQTFHSSSASVAFEAFIYLLTLFSFLGIATALRRKDRNLSVPSLIYVCLCIAHSITYVDLMYYYVKVPFLYIFSGFFLNEISPYSLMLPFSTRKISVAFLVKCLLVGYVLALGVIVR